ncbi:Hsp70 family protein [Ruegeria sp. ANG-R]|uniref:Hsp70 family protein n=1 Tax=Ruegeria sp. ANG-R TaxID=1577903 RepID=UPI00068B9C60|nr:Hsp70 family protein [Ruegeria sp. ANG-R]
MPVQEKAPILAVDFGTSNSAAAMLADGKITRLPLEPDRDTIPTSVFFNADDNSTYYGTAANIALSEGEPGRYMRSLKSLLGSPIMSESRLLNGRRMDGFDIICDYLTTIKARAEDCTGLSFSHALAGRPVHFHTRDQVKDAQAEADLKQCFLRAGFEHVDFMAEPEAAALSEQDKLHRNSLGLVVDIGGGTSDFTLFRKGKEATEYRLIDILASHGLRLGGTDFDRQTSLNFFMPHLGHKSKIRRAMADETVTAPISIFADLSTWEKIPFLYNAKTLREVRELIYLAPKKRPFERLKNVIEFESGHELAMLTEATKIALNTTDQGYQHVDLSLLDSGLTTDITVDEFDAAIMKSSDILRREIEETLAKAHCAAEDVSQIIEVGGGGKMKLVRQSLKDLFPNAEILSGATFTAVVDGLAMATETRRQVQAGSGNTFVVN